MAEMSEYKHLTELEQAIVVYGVKDGLSSIHTLAAALESAREELERVEGERDDAKAAAKKHWHWWQQEQKVSSEVVLKYATQRDDAYLDRDAALADLATVTAERDEARGEVARLVRESGIVQDSLHEAARDFRDERDTARAALEESRTDRDVFRGATNAALLDLADAEARIGELEERVAADSTAAILGASCAEIRDALTARAPRGR